MLQLCRVGGQTCLLGKCRHGTTMVRRYAEVDGFGFERSENTYFSKYNMGA